MPGRIPTVEADGSKREWYFQYCAADLLFEHQQATGNALHRREETIIEL